MSPHCANGANETTRNVVRIAIEQHQRLLRDCRAIQFVLPWGANAAAILQAAFSYQNYHSDDCLWCSRSPVKSISNRLRRYHRSFFTILAWQSQFDVRHILYNFFLCCGSNCTVWRKVLIHSQHYEYLSLTSVDNPALERNIKHIYQNTEYLTGGESYI